MGIVSAYAADSATDHSPGLSSNGAIRGRTMWCLCHAWLDLAEQKTVPSSFVGTWGHDQGRIASARSRMDNRTYVRIDPALPAQRALDGTGSQILPERSPAQSWPGARRCGALFPERWSPPNAHVPSLRHNDLHPAAAHRLRSLLITVSLREPVPHACP